MDSLPDGCAKQFQQVFGNVSSRQGYRRPVRRRRRRLNISLSQSLTRADFSRLFSFISPLLQNTGETTRTWKAAASPLWFQRWFQRITMLLTHPRILSSLPHPLLLLLQLPCLLVPLSCTPSFALKDSVIFRRHVLHASHLHSSTHAGIISPTIIYVCLFLAGRR